MPELRSGVRCGCAAAAITPKESEPDTDTKTLEALKLDSDKPFIPLLENEEGVNVKGDESANNKDKGFGVAIEDLPFQDKVQVGGSPTKKCTASVDCESYDDIQQNSSTNINESFKDFPQDLIPVILSLVPLECLLNSARYVSKSWATTIQSCLCIKPPGIYFEDVDSEERASYFLNIQDRSQFEKIYLGIPSRMGEIIATCDGILLLCDCYNLRLTFVVNPILKCFFRIPPLLISERVTVQYQSTIARVSCSTKFKLFLVDVKNVSGVNCYVFYVLRIGIDNTWKEIARKEVILREIDFLSEPICYGDNDIYWMTTNGVIVMDVDKETIIKEYPLPPLGLNDCPYGNFLWMGDRLSHIKVVAEDMKGLTYQVYTLNLDLENWTLYLKMGPFDFASCDNEFEFDNNLWLAGVDFRFWINDQIFFEAIFFPKRMQQYLGLDRGHFCYNVKTKQLIKIDGIAVDKFRAWLHTNTLILLPSTPV